MLSHQARRYDALQHLLAQIISTGEKNGLVATVKRWQGCVWTRAFTYHGHVDATSSTPAYGELEIKFKPLPHPKQAKGEMGSRNIAHCGSHETEA